jgi:hypothetical protein
MSEPEYVFGVRPGGTFRVHDSKATFYVVNQGSKLIRVSVEVLEPWPDFNVAVGTVARGEFSPSIQIHTATGEGRIVGYAVVENSSSGQASTVRRSSSTSG